MKIGIIFTIFNCAESVDKFLEVWKLVKFIPPDLQDNFIFSCVSVPFDKFEVGKIDNTAEIIKSKNIMDFLYVDENPRSEIEARGICLEFLKNQNCEIIWQIDSDEQFSAGNIYKILEFVKLNPKIAWFLVSYKNYVFDSKTYLAAPFQPARIYRVDFPPYKLGGFRDDNNLTFFKEGNGKKIEFPDLFLKSKIIPPEVAFVPHYSWMSDERSRAKINYQKARGWTPSFRWNEQENKLEFNPAAYPNGFPKVITES